MIRTASKSRLRSRPKNTTRSWRTNNRFWNRPWLPGNSKLVPTRTRIAKRRLLPRWLAVDNGGAPVRRQGFSQCVDALHAYPVFELAFQASQNPHGVIAKVARLVPEQYVWGAFWVLVSFKLDEPGFFHFRKHWT